VSASGGGGSFPGSGAGAGDAQGPSLGESFLAAFPFLASALHNPAAWQQTQAQPAAVAQRTRTLLLPGYWRPLTPAPVSAASAVARPSSSQGQALPVVAQQQQQQQLLTQPLVRGGAGGGGGASWVASVLQPSVAQSPYPVVLAPPLSPAQEAELVDTALRLLAANKKGAAAAAGSTGKAGKQQHAAQGATTAAAAAASAGGAGAAAAVSGPPSRFVHVARLLCVFCDPALARSTPRAIQPVPANPGCPLARARADTSTHAWFAWFDCPLFQREREAAVGDGEPAKQLGQHGLGRTRRCTAGRG
jgi:hypothetical protein